jgi:hypothetical protein
MADVYGGLIGPLPQARELERWRLGRAKKITEGKWRPWEESSFRPVAEGIRTGTERSLENLPSVLSRTGVSGPAAGTMLEQTKQGGENQILNLAKNMIGMGEGEIGWGTDEASRLFNEQMQLANLFEARKRRKQANISDLQKGISMGKDVSGAIAALISSITGGGGEGG